MNKYKVIKKIEQFAPLETQERWDASGWIVDLPNKDINKILFALTITPNIINQAENNGCDLIISHHPLFFVPLEYRKINMYCAHTNLDKANGGTTDLILEKLNFEGKPINDFVRIVELEKEITIEDLKNKLLKISPKLRYVNNTGIKNIKTLGFCAGSGSEFINEVECDAFITGDIKFHTAVESNKVIFDIGHFESEIFAVELLKILTEVGEKGIIANEKSPFI